MIDIAQYRLSAHGLLKPDTDDVALIVSKLGAMQAQDYQDGLWSIGARMKNPSLSMVESAIKNYDIVRTWPMRGTLHFVAGRDIRWIVALLGPRAIASAASRRKQLGITDEVLSKARSVIEKTLTGTDGVSRSDLCAELDRNGIESANQRGLHIIHYFSELGIVCFGPHQVKEPTFVLVDEHIAAAPILTREESLVELAARYFSGHAPATLKDFAGWGYMTMGDAKYGLEGARSRLAEVESSTGSYFYEEQLVAADNTTLLLPGFDEYVLGYKDRTAIIKSEHMQHVVPGNNGMFLASIAVDGRIVGLWKKTVRKSGISIQPISFERDEIITNARLETAAERYASFLGTAVTVNENIIYL